MLGQRRRVISGTKAQVCLGSESECRCPERCQREGVRWAGLLPVTGRGLGGSMGLSWGE